jgi:TonB family protein
VQFSAVRLSLAILWLFAFLQLYGQGSAVTQVTVPSIPGPFVSPVPNAPFSGTLQIVSKQRLPDGTVYELKTITYIARDSRGRTHSESRKLVYGSYEQEPPINDIHIYDPATQISIHYDPLTRIARQTKMHAPPVPNPRAVPNPNPQDAKDPLTQVGLGSKSFKNLTLTGTLQVRSPTDSNEFWYSPELSIYMMRTHKDAVWEQTVNIADLDRLEPDPGNFLVPAGYKIIDLPESIPAASAARPGGPQGSPPEDAKTETTGSSNRPTVPSIQGVYFKPVTGSPFSGTAEIVSKQKLADGSIFVLKTVNYIARDSRGRTYGENRRLVAADYEKEPIVNYLHLYDAVTGFSTDLDPYTHIAKQSGPVMLLADNPRAIPLPEVANASRRDLGSRTFHGFQLNGYWQSTGADESDEFWYSPDLSIFISRKHVDPVWEQTVNVIDVERGEPDPANFVVPASYRVIQNADERGATPSVSATNSVDILSDTLGVDLSPYIQKVVDATYRSWLPVVPAAARPPQKKQGRVIIRFRINKDGSVSNMTLEVPSGDVLLDRAAWGGLTGASLPKLPAEFKGPCLDLRFYFNYNLDLTQGALKK